MKIAAINTAAFGSTGKIALQILKKAQTQHENRLYVASSRSNKRVKVTEVEKKYIGSIFSRNIHLLLNKYTGFNGCFSTMATLRLICDLKKYKTDLIHLHNLHNCYINLPLLFRYIKKCNIPVVWTFHDCWAFTGHCPHFTFAKCEKWKTGCYACPQHKLYPKSYVDNSKIMWKLKRKWFTGVGNMTIVTPSEWLVNLVKQSYLKDYPVKVINNGIDLKIFKPTDSDFIKKYNLQNKYVVLGVAFDWGVRKGMDVFIKLAEGLNGNYQIVLVGTDDNVDKLLPQNIISIHRTHNQEELAAIYSAADVFVNPTREENYPTVNMEAIACGTPVVTSNTGGSPEILDKTCGSVVPCEDIDALEKEIIRICVDKPYSKEACLKRAESFGADRRFEEYVELYEKIVDEGGK